MRILIVNKFLYPNGGSETYIFKITDEEEEVQVTRRSIRQSSSHTLLNIILSSMAYHPLLLSL